MRRKFTGLCDKNDQKIYSGDIIKKDKSKYLVFFSKYKNTWMATNTRGWAISGDKLLEKINKDCEIIGII